VQSDEGRKLTFIRIYSGTLRAGGMVLNSSRSSQERSARLFRMHAHKRERIDEAFAGDIVAAAGLKDALPATPSATLPAAPLANSHLPAVVPWPWSKGTEDKDSSCRHWTNRWEDPTLPRP
jgi:elongation factor G